MKRMITLLIAMLMVFSLAACSGTGSSAEKSSTIQNATEQSDSSEGTLYTVTVKDQDGNQVCRMNTARGLISSEQNFVDNSKLEICETVDIHSEVSRHVETVVLLTRNS